VVQSVIHNYKGRVKLNNFFVLAGPSGVGKTFLINSLIAAKPDDIVHPLTYTTRPIRAGEVNGRDMNFISHALFTPRLIGKEFLASTEYDGHYYGTLKEDILNPINQGKKVVVAFDESGVECVRHSGYGATYCYLYAPSTRDLEKRLLHRWPEKGDDYGRRLGQSIQELRRFQTDSKFQNKFDCWVCVEDDITLVVKSMLELMGFYV